MEADSVEHLRSMVALDEVGRYEPLRIAARVDVLDQGVAASGVPYMRMDLYDSTGAVPAWARCRDWEGHGLMTGQLRTLSLHTLADTPSGQRRIVAYPEVGAPPSQRSALEFLPVHRAPWPDDCRRLVGLAQEIEVLAYREFLQDVFADPEFALGFLTAPAAQQCHHAQGGGLLHHSLDVAEAARAAADTIGLNVISKEAGVMLGLFHDVGKWVLNSDADRIPTRQHEALIEYALEQPLQRLRQRDLDAYHALWQVIHAYRTGDHYVAPMAAVVRGLDSCSAQTDAAAMIPRNGGHRYWHRLCGGRMVWIPPCRGSDVPRFPET